MFLMRNIQTPTYMKRLSNHVFLIPFKTIILVFLPMDKQEVEKHLQC